MLLKSNNKVKILTINIITLNILNKKFTNPVCLIAMMKFR